MDSVVARYVINVGGDAPKDDYIKINYQMFITMRENVYQSLQLI
jgi:hypothetical protein